MKTKSHRVYAELEVVGLCRADSLQGGHQRVVRVLDLGVAHAMTDRR